MPGSIVEGVLQCLRRKIEDWLFPLRMALGRKITYDENRKIVQVSRTELIKGPCSSQELQAMRYIAAHPETTVNAPKVHRTYQRRDGLYIAMDFIRGERLDHVWIELSEQEQYKVVEQIWEAISGMRGLPAPNVAISSIRGGSVRDGAVTQDNFGPFARLEEFENVVKRSPGVDEFKRFWTPPGQSYKTCLTHADIAARNIIRDGSGRLVIIDWEFAGWWPSYWEYVKWHFADYPPLPGWTDLLDDVSNEGCIRT